MIWATFALAESNYSPNNFNLLILGLVVYGLVLTGVTALELSLDPSNTPSIIFS